MVKIINCNLFWSLLLFSFVSCQSAEKNNNNKNTDLNKNIFLSSNVNIQGQLSVADFQEISLLLKNEKKLPSFSYIKEIILEGEATRRAHIKILSRDDLQDPSNYDAPMNYLLFEIRLIQKNNGAWSIESIVEESWTMDVYS